MSAVKKIINTFLLSMFVLVCALMPAKSYGMKEFFLGSLLLFNIDVILNGFIKYKSVLFFSLLTPAWLLFVSIANGADIIDSVKSVYFFSFIWLSVIAIKYNIDLKKIFIEVTFLIALMINFLVFMHLLNIIPMQANPLAIFLRESGNAQLSYGEVAVFYFVFFLNACPLMFFPLTDAFMSGKNLRIIIILLALMFSGTRANICLALFVPIACFILYRANDLKKIIFMTGLGLTFFYTIPIYLPTIIKKITIINSAKGGGDSLRTGRTIAALKEIFDSIGVCLFGMGANVPFKANGILNYSSEMSYVEIWRIYGIFSLILTIGLLLLLFWKNRKSFYTIAFLAYLMVCAVDPFLMSSTGFLMIMFMFYLYIKDSRKLSIDS